MNKKFAYLIGVLHDAHIINKKSNSQYGFEIEQKNKKYAEFLSTFFSQLFKIEKPKLELRERSWGNYWRIRIYSKKIFEEIVQYDFTKIIKSQSKQIKKEMIRGFYDAEGSVSSDEVRMFNKNTKLLETLHDILSTEFNLRLGKIVVSKDDVYQLPIYAKNDKNRFMKIFKPIHPDKFKIFS